MSNRGEKRPFAARLMLEGLVIVASILAAFALDTWWDSVQERAEEQEALQALDAEFTAARATFEFVLEQRHRRVLNSVGSIRSSLRAAAREGRPGVLVPDTALGWLYIPSTTQPTLGTLNGLVASARLGIIRDHELRAALASWGRTLEEATEEEVLAHNYVFTELDGVLRRHVNVAPFRWIARDLLDGVLTTEEAEARTLLPVDTEIIGVVEGRYAILDHGIDEFGPVLEEIDRLLALIRQSRRDE